MRPLCRYSCSHKCCLSKYSLRFCVSRCPFPAVCNGALPAVPNGAFPTTCTGAAVAGTCTAVCNTGFTGSPVSTCLDTGAWSDVSGACTKSLTTGMAFLVSQGDDGSTGAVSYAGRVHLGRPAPYVLSTGTVHLGRPASYVLSTGTVHLHRMFCLREECTCTVCLVFSAGVCGSPAC